jgi:NAD(P)-dependent dehydrogenase (short-subunit alcohol dehydrogenase family)
MKKIIVLGGGGFIGGHLAKRLKNEGNYVIGIDLKYPEYKEELKTYINDTLTVEADATFATKTELGASVEEIERLEQSIENQYSRNQIISEIAETVVTIAVTPEKKPVVQTSEQRKLESAKRQEINARIKPLKKQIDQVEKSMTQLQSEKTVLEAKLLEPISPSDIADIGKKLKVINDELTSLEEKWLGWTSEIEVIESEASQV